jgi:hypothetical protein
LQIAISWKEESLQSHRRERNKLAFTPEADDSLFFADSDFLEGGKFEIPQTGKKQVGVQYSNRLSVEKCKSEGGNLMSKGGFTRGMV